MASGPPGLPAAVCSTATAWFRAASPAASAAVLVGACRAPRDRGRWNVLVILVDTLRADHLGAYGYGRPTSPHLDDLARQSYLFTQARAQASCTFPSANSILTARYPAAF